MVVSKEYIIIKLLHHRVMEEIPDLMLVLNRGKNLYEPFFLDQTWVFSKGSICKKTWQDGSVNTALAKTGKNCRYIVVHAGNKNGFVEGASLIFKANSKLGDYHDNVNQENFEKWFKEQLIPSLREPFLFVIDNASYHSRFEEEIPRKSWTKTKMITYLNGIDYAPKTMKDQIWGILVNKQSQKRYHLDLHTQHHGHWVLRLPPYHCHFNAIEMAWSEVRRNNDKIIPRT
ncbi:uncharacterized protein LOC135138682 [Zophobas morio]|uniref:uncharacterized protein LOC135138682 n=1 Tax=Zophobas morio TaxID=2755281 RepID=UPI003083562D